MQEVIIHTEIIKLDQFLKWAGIVSTGGMAKQLIAEGMIKVNGNCETKRGKILKPGDTVEVSNYGSYCISMGQ